MRKRWTMALLIAAAVLVVAAALLFRGEEPGRTEEGARKPPEMAGRASDTDEAKRGHEEAAGEPGVPVDREPALGGKVMVCVNCGADRPYTDKAGRVWAPDQDKLPENTWGAVGGSLVPRDPEDIPGTDAPEVYLTERYGMAAYEFYVENGTYTLRLHFAETYVDIFGPGERVFSIKVNGVELITDMDPYKESGGLFKPVVKTLKGIVVTDGKLVIEFVPDIQNPEINGIEVIAE